MARAHNDPAELRQQLATELLRLRTAAGMTQAQLAAAIGYATSHSLIGHAEKCRKPLSLNLCARIDKHLHTGGILHRLESAARAAQRHQKVLDAARELGHDTPAAAGAEEVETTDRREVLLAAGLLGAAGPGETIRDLADRIATADPTPLALADLEAAVGRAAADYGVLPMADLRARLAPEHAGVEALLDRRPSRRAREKLTLLAGQYCFYLGWTSYNIGADADARAYLAMTEHHAAESGDPLLAGSVAELRIGLMPDCPAAADVALRARTAPGAHPYTAPFLAALEARMAALLGQGDRARAALADAEANVWQGPPLPGAAIFDVEAAHAWMAIVLGHLGDGEKAEANARASLKLLAAGRHPAFLAAGTYNALARAQIHRMDPEPEQAADSITEALTCLEGRPTRNAIESARVSWRELAARWPGLPAVRELGERFVAARRSLPAPVRPTGLSTL